MVVGAFFAMTDIRPIPLIILAQGVNGIILPLVGIMLFILINRRYKDVLGRRNPWPNNFVLAIVVLVCIMLGGYGIYSVALTVFQ
jgi:Mn2+/Fe2+ NRAMP family transporter